MSQKLAKFVKVNFLRFHLHVVISFWRKCMVYSKYFLNDKRMYHLNLWIKFLPEPNHFSSASAVVIGVILFYFSDILYMLMHLTPCNFVVAFVLPFFCFLPFRRFRIHCWLHIGSFPSSSTSAKYNSSEFSPGFSLDKIFITYKTNIDLSFLLTNFLFFQQNWIVILQ